MMKRFISWLLFLLMGASYHLWAMQTIRVGIFDYPPLVQTNSHGKPEGLVIHLLEDIARKRDWRLEYVPAEFNQTLDNLNNGRVDIVPCLWRSQQFDYRFRFNDQSVAMDYGQIYSRPGISIHGFSDFSGKIVAGKKEDPFFEELKHILNGLNIQYEQEYGDSYDEVLTMLEENKADTAIVSLLLTEKRTKKTRLVRSMPVNQPVQLYFAVSRGVSNNILTVIDEEFSTIRKDPLSSYNRNLRHIYGKGMRRVVPRWLQIIALSVPAVTAILLLFTLLLKHQVKRKTGQIQQRDLLMEGVVRASQALLVYSNYDEAIQKALGIIGEYADKDVVAVYENCLDHECGPEHSALRYLWCREEKPDSSGDATQLAEINHSVFPQWLDKLRGGQSIQVLSRKMGEEQRLILDKQKIRSLLVVPIMIEEDFWGFMIVADSQKDALFSDSENNVLRVAADILGGAIFRKKSEEALRESEEFSSNLLGKSPDPIIVADSEGLISYFNTAMEKLTGFTAEDFSGADAPFLFWLAQQLEENSIDGKTPVVGEKVELNLKKPDGEIIFVDATTTAILDEKGQSKYFLSIWQDITERKRAEMALRESEERFKRLSEATFEGIIVHDGEEILDFNRSLLEMFGYDLPEVVGLKATDFVAEEYRGRFAHQFESEKEDRFEALGLCKDGKRFPCEVRSKRFPFFGQDARVSALRDISDRKRAEEELRCLYEDLEQMVFERTRQLQIANDELENLNEITKQLSGTLDFDTLVNRIVEFLTVSYNFEACALLLVNSDKISYHIEKSIGPVEFSRLMDPQKEERIPLKKTGSLISACILNNQNIFIPDLDEMGKEVSVDWGLVEDLQIRSILLLPIIAENEVIGAFSLTTHTRTIDLSSEDITSVSRFANQIALVIRNSILYNEMEKTKNQLEKALEDLKAAQNRIVVQEKMASLGELTAGIAHEIKNPLNFVNNFSQLSMEMIDDFEKYVRSKGKCWDEKTQEEINYLVDNLKGNLTRINEHGKRADSIVQGMLLHSRGKAGERQLVDINKLTEEYLNLAYHGLRAKNPSFNVTLQKEFDKNMPLMEVVPQELSRAFLNIITNACYAANAKKGRLEEQAEFGKGWEFNPTVKVSTKKVKNMVEIRIRDNGEGIPSEIKDKIFNPFFTTKPAGEGTGLGLSISYDIIVQEHNGEIRIETAPDEYTEFVILLPLDKIRK